MIDIVNGGDGPRAEIDASWTVNEVVARHPETLSLFAELGIDACCGGAKSLAEVARRHGGGDPTQLVATLRGAILAPENPNVRAEY